MGLLKRFIKNGVSLAGKHVMNWANAATGGLAGKVADNVVNKVNKHSGVIGKVAQGIGRKLFSDKTREKMSNLADSAIKYLPKGNVRTALEKVNNAAQGRSNDFKSRYNKQLNSSQPTSPISSKFVKSEG